MLPYKIIFKNDGWNAYLNSSNIHSWYMLNCIEDWNFRYISGLSDIWEYIFEFENEDDCVRCKLTWM